MVSEASVSAQFENDPDQVFTFPLGIPGFEKYTKYHIFHKEGNNNVYWLESCDDPEVTFTLVDPTNFGLNFQLELTDEEQELLKAESYETIAVFLMLSKKEDEMGVGRLNANIAGPVLINVENCTGFQKVIVKSHFEMNVVQES